MKSTIKIILAAIIVTLFGCTDQWDEHYNTPPETINTNVWEAIKSNSELSSFVTLMEKYKYDTLFLSDDTYTLFVPDNSAMEKMVQSQVSDTTILNYHISRHFVQPVDIQGKRKLQTLAEKFSTFENVEGKPTYDGIAINYESPLYINGKYFIMAEVATPKLNLYEYFAVNNPYLKNYIDSKDTTIIDQEKSRAIGFNDKGETVYDTVSIKGNLFEDEYFPVSKEFRKWTATVVFPRIENYKNGLNLMAQKLGGNFHDYNQIPPEWQEKVLIPYLIKNGVFLNMLEVNEFKDKSVLTFKRKYSMANINGDSIIADYTPVEPYLCSNGIFYDYKNFIVPEKLYSDTVKMEGESLLRKKGENSYEWRSKVKVNPPSTFLVKRDYIKEASNDSILITNFPKGYTGPFSVEFPGVDLFPRKYRMEVLTHMDVGGIYDIYVNNVLVTNFNYYNYVKLRGIINSVVPGVKFVPKGRYNKFDCYVDNIIKYGKPTIRFEYKGPGNVPGNGLAIDAIYFIPVAN
ncbi:MAG: fasciclin domain-containing protein [Candidatus Saccharibacteria bacterium]